MLLQQPIRVSAFFSPRHKIILQMCMADLSDYAKYRPPVSSYACEEHIYKYAINNRPRFNASNPIGLLLLNDTDLLKCIWSDHMLPWLHCNSK